MVKIDILIPSNKKRHLCLSQIEAITNTVKSNARIIHTGFDKSAAENRNLALSNVVDVDYIIMLDDDITGFYDGWDLDLIRPLKDDSVMLVSARLKNKDFTYQDTIGDVKDYKSKYVKTNHNIIPSCAIVYRGEDKDLRFDTAYKGSGFEDTDIMLQFQSRYPGKFIVINNQCQLVHNHEGKNQSETFWVNRCYFQKKWKLNDVEIYNYH